MTATRQIDDPENTVVSSGVREQRFDAACAGRRVPSLLWTPEAGACKGIALLGHGGSLHKRADYILGTARRLVRHTQFAALAIDGPGHGERREDGGTDPTSVGRDFDAEFDRPEIADETVADWKAALDVATGAVGELPVTYFGLSMGTMLGLPLVVSEPRIRSAVLGLMGLWGPTRDRLRQDAPKLSVPVRFLVQWDDEIVPRDSALELFDLLGTRQKELRAHPGPHVAVPPDEMRAVPEFLARHIG